MINKDVIFPVLAAVIPVWIYELVKSKLDVKDFNLTVMILACVTSFVALVVLFALLDGVLNRLKLYCGQWVEELTNLDDADDRLIGIGIIRHDRKTNEYIFTGASYTTEGVEKYLWTIDYLRQDKDNSMQYLCGVQIPNEISIGKLTFDNRNEFEGNIWIVNGVNYKINAYRITQSLANDLGIHIPSFKRVKISKRDCPSFVCKYVNKYLSPNRN